MTKEQFMSLSLKEKADLVYTKGASLHCFHFQGFKTELFVLDSLYIEARYYPDNYVVCLDVATLDDLEKHLDEIKI